MNGFYTRRNIIIGYIISLGILSFFGIFTYLNMQKARKENLHVSETLQSIKVLEKVLDDILNIETSQRGYVITGKQSFLDPYHSALSDLKDDTIALKALIKINPERKRSYNNILSLVRSKIAFIQETIRIRDEEGYEAAVNRIQTETGRSIMDSIRALVIEVEQESQAYLRKSRSLREEASQSSTMFFLILAIGFVLILFLIFLFVNKSLNRQAKFERQLQQFKTAIDSSGDMIFIIDPSELQVLDINETSAQLTGYRQEELLANDFSDLWPGITKEKIKEELERVFTPSAGAVLISTLCKRKDSTFFDAEISFHSLKYKDKHLVVATVRDITVQKKLENDLQQLNEHLEEEVRRKTTELSNVFDRMSDAVIAFDKNFCYTYLNKKAGEMIRKDPAQLIGKNIWDVFPDAVGSATYEAFNKAMAEQKYVSNVDYYPPLDLWQENHFYPSPDGLSLFIRDISERKRTEKALAESEERFRTIFETEPECVKLLDKDGKIIDMNPTGLIYIEATDINQVKGKRVRDLVSPEFQVEFDNLVKKVFAGQAVSFEFKINGLRGTSRWMNTHAVPLKDQEGNIIAMLGVTRDVSDKLEAEEKLQKSYQDLRQLTSRLQEIREEERTGIAREIHDELGQQLTVLKMDIAWLNKKVNRDDPSIKEKLDQLTYILDETVKTVRRISSELRPSVLDNLGLIAAMDWHLKEFEKRSGIKTEFNEPDTGPQLGNSIKTTLYRIFQESLTNVARHSNAEKVKVKLETNNKEIVLIIEDNGKGFDKFKIAEKKTLGILGMKERAMMLGGSYEVISTPGSGTRSKIVVPVRN